MNLLSLSPSGKEGQKLKAKEFQGMKMKMNNWFSWGTQQEEASLVGKPLQFKITFDFS
jgi:hypothetical protein